jgi:hypothetical protein
MTDRCFHPDHTADPVVFGDCPCRRPPQRTLPPLVPSSWFVVPQEEPCPVTRVEIPDPRYDENPIHLLLGPDELED